MNRKTLWAILVFAFLAALVAVASALRESLLPMFFAFGLAYAFSPVVDRLEREGVPRATSVAGLMLSLALVFALLIVAIIPPLLQDARDFAANYPLYFSKAVSTLDEMAGRLGLEMPVKQDLLEKGRAYLQTLPPASVPPVLSALQRVFSGVAGFIVVILNFLLIPVFFFFFLRDLPATKRYVYSVLPVRHRAFVKKKYAEIDTVLSGYVRGQMTVCFMLSCIFSVGLSAMGVKFGLFIGILSGMLQVIPYLGQLLGLTLALTMALVDFTGWGRLVAIPVFFAATNFIEGTFITPRIVGGRVGLSPVQTILALIVGGELGGLWGLIVAIPVAGCLKVLLLDAVRAYQRSELYEEPSRA